MLIGLPPPDCALRPADHHNVFARHVRNAVNLGVACVSCAMPMFTRGARLSAARV